MPDDDNNFWDCIDRLDPESDGPIAALIESASSRHSTAALVMWP